MFISTNLFLYCGKCFTHYTFFCKMYFCHSCKGLMILYENHMIAYYVPNILEDKSILLLNWSVDLLIFVTCAVSLFNTLLSFKFCTGTSFPTFDIFSCSFISYVQSHNSSVLQRLYFSVITSTILSDYSLFFIFVIIFSIESTRFSCQLELLVFLFIICNLFLFIIRFLHLW